MKERPILFSAPMVRAILAGTKTQTRRVVKPVGDDDGFVLLDHGNGYWPYRSDDGESSFHTVKRGGKEYLDETPHACPYGQPGDRLWVRETFSWPRHQDGYAPSLWHSMDEIWYWADGNPDDGDWTRPRPSIHMPRFASRIDLEITGVRVERLADISEADAIAEGIYKDPDDEIPFNGPYYPENTDSQGYWTARDAYCELWESLNGTGSWAANPWVWVIEFRRAEQ